ncbi:MAG: asparagine synthase (glutamine-hydrolyzing) [Gemmatimonadaceae bacterium]|nr:asparagine synthase (glutamine-hydrolyzing) [Gemmatimonadaceae bacterium]
MIQRRPFHGDEIIAMSESIRHRGPDDEGFLLLEGRSLRRFGGVATPADAYASSLPYAPTHRMDAGWRSEAGGLLLGHRRLSIIDLSANGHQPMSLADRYWLSFNGEVYNFIELRRELEALGHTIVGDSDSAVILAAYAEWGETCVERFNGMWGLAILDTERRTLFVARDRFGVKPMYFYLRPDGLAFSSEIKAFSVLPEWQARANVSRVVDFLVWNVSDHTDETMFDGVFPLPAGHTARIDLDAMLAAGAPPTREQLGMRRWYTLTPRTLGPREDREHALREALQDAVRLRLRADVPVGSCLSGGLDSSAIVSLMRRTLSADGAPDHAIHTFTARSDVAAFDEMRFADTVVSASRTTSHVVTPQPDQLFADLDRILWHQDEPFLSTSIFAQWCVFEAARRERVTVLLDGQGADELLGGYPGYFGAYLAGLVRRGAFMQWMREASALRREARFTARRLVGYTAAYLFPGLVKTLGRFDNRAYTDVEWIAPSVRDRAAVDPLLAAGGRASSVRDLTRAQMSRTHLPMLLHWEDRNSMAFSIEARLPFLDFRVAELALGLEDEDKVGGGVAKHVLRRAMRGVVPDAVLDRRDKMGFVTAEPAWVRGPASLEFRRRLDDAVSALPGLLSPTILRQFDEVRTGARPFDQRYWRAIILGRWVERFNVRL